MKYVEIVADAQSLHSVAAIAEKAKSIDFRAGMVGDDGMQLMRMLVTDDHLQLALDTLQNILGAQPTARIIVMPVEAMIPKLDAKDNKITDAATAAREVLYEEIRKGARLDRNFLILVTLSTIVAAIGLIDNNVAVVIGAMVIAPLLGPNLALSLGTALGDGNLIRKSIQTLFAGIFLAIMLSAGFGFIGSSASASHELMMRTTASLDSVVLALSSGAAAALSLTTGLSGVLVGVMVAVALLPPAATAGFMLGGGHLSLALGAGILLAINIVCVNLASKIVFYLKGVHPRSWMQKEKAKRAMLRYVAGWILTLLILVLLVVFRIH